MSESNLGRKITMAVSNIGSRVFRFNTALSWAGKVFRWPEPRNVTMTPGDVLIRNARPIHSGFEGASDYIGWTPMTITQRMVGKKVAVFTAVEVKDETGRITPEQKHFIDVVKDAGGIGIIPRSPEEAVSEIQNFKQGI